MDANRRRFILAAAFGACVPSIVRAEGLLGSPGDALATRGPATRPNDGVYERLRHSIAASRFDNPRTRAAMASPPMIAVTSGANGSAAAAPADLTQAFTTLAKPGLFTTFGGPTFLLKHNDAFYRHVLTNKTPNRLPFLTGAFRHVVMTDSGRCAFRLFGKPGKIRFIIDGRYADTTGHYLPAEDNFVTLDFSNAGGRAMRRIEVVADGASFGLNGLHVGPTESVSRAMGSPLRVAFLGDSYFTASGDDVTWDDSLPAVASDYMGTPDVLALGEGGTGFLLGAAPLVYPYIKRVSDITDNSVDLAIVGTASNDQFAYTGSQIASAVSAFIAAVRAKCPQLPMIFIGAWPNQFGVTATNAMADRAVGAAVAAATAAGDRNLIYLPCVLDPNGPWLTGTGNTAHRKGDGNLDVYGATDGSHLNVKGFDFAAQRLVDEISLAISKM